MSQADRGSVQRYLNDFDLGESFVGSGTTLTDAHFLFFAALSGDNHPIHYDEVYAAQHPMGKRLAHGLLLMSLTAVGASPLSPQITDSLIAFVGQSCRFLNAATVGDTVHAEYTVSGVEKKKDGRGLLRLSVQLVKYPSTVLLEGEHIYLMKERGIE